VTDLSALRGLVRRGTHIDVEARLWPQLTALGTTEF
jgi:hypothetical protein